MCGADVSHLADLLLRLPPNDQRKIAMLIMILYERHTAQFTQVRAALRKGDYAEADRVLSELIKGD